MSLILANWQTPTAIGVVLITALIFAVRIWRGRSAKGDGCGHGCGCGLEKEGALSKKER